MKKSKNLIPHTEIVHPLICTLTLYRYSPLSFEMAFFIPQKKHTTLQKLNKSN